MARYLKTSPIASSFGKGDRRPAASSSKHQTMATAIMRPYRWEQSKSSNRKNWQHTNPTRQQGSSPARLARRVSVAGSPAAIKQAESLHELPRIARFFAGAETRRL